MAYLGRTRCDCSHAVQKTILLQGCDGVHGACVARGVALALRFRTVRSMKSSRGHHQCLKNFLSTVTILTV
jgi:hypothetical protein